MGWCPSCLTRCSLLCWLLSDINELKVFVDLASISAGENDMDVDRVACFHGSVHGYSSLLYELQHHSGFEDFMRCLQKLWRALDSDETLPQKLVSSAGAGPQHLPAFLPSRVAGSWTALGKWHLCGGITAAPVMGGKTSDVSAAAVTGVAQVSPGHCQALQCDGV